MYAEFRGAWLPYGQSILFLSTIQLPDGGHAISAADLIRQLDIPTSIYSGKSSLPNHSHILVLTFISGACFSVVTCNNLQSSYIPILYIYEDGSFHQSPDLIFLPLSNSLTILITAVSHFSIILILHLITLILLDRTHCPGSKSVVFTQSKY